MNHELPSTGETNLATLIKTMRPVLNAGEYVFCTVPHGSAVNVSTIVALFNEQEAVTIVLEKTVADKLGLHYSFIASWITLTVHSSLEASGLTAAFSKALAGENISCNVIAANYHDHIFVAKADAEKAMQVLQALSSLQG